ncbi:MAG: TIGR03751 family conjugal transfer lipoprotein [Herminiimonas sp.]|nr:TIGR03751 family conjugal transfer lipoprotein [Herminiimonas sp.]
MDSINQHPIARACALGLFLAATLGGCAVSGPKESALSQDGPTMVEIYRKHMGDVREDGGAVRDRLPLRAPTEASPGELRRSMMSGIDNRFPRLPNPDLVMFVLPHLAKGRYPIPGYVTVFPMYERVEYAMPGEVTTRKPVAHARTKSAGDPAALNK